MLSPIEVSPTEPSIYKAYGDITSSRPEKYGVDYIWSVGEFLWGVQRKRTDDFLTSYFDGRLSKESYQIHDIHQAILIIEGTFNFNSATGKLLERGRMGNLTRLSIQKMLFTLQAKDGWQVLSVKDAGEFGNLLYALYNQSESFENRASARREGRKAQSALERLLQSIDGVGARKAREIATAYPGAIQVSVTRDELLRLPGVGPGTVEKIFSALNR